MKKIAVLAFVMLLFANVSAFAMQTIKDSYSDKELVQILKDGGYTSVVNEKEGKVVITIDGTRYVLFNLSDGDLQLYYYISGASISYEKINEWNRTKRLSRAYLDRDNDPVIEADLMANGGLTQENITAFMQVFKYSVERFRDFVREY